MAKRKASTDNYSNSADAYRVGYGRPPKHSQFQPGQSGNPNGRPKGSPNVLSSFQRLITKKVKVNTPNGEQELTLMECVLQALVTKAAQGHLPSIQQCIQLATAYDAKTGNTDRPSGVLVVPGLLDPDEWDARFGIGDDENAAKKALPPKGH